MPLGEAKRAMCRALPDAGPLRSNGSLMNSAKKSSLFAFFLMSLIILAGCSHAITTGGCVTNCGGGGGTGPFTISGTVTGLTGTGLILQDNGGDDFLCPPPRQLRLVQWLVAVALRQPQSPPSL